VTARDRQWIKVNKEKYIHDRTLRIRRQERLLGQYSYDSTQVNLLKIRRHNDLIIEAFTIIYNYNYQRVTCYKHLFPVVYISLTMILKGHEI
jgi:hypothetical protein